MMTEQSRELFARAKRVIPGGVNSPVRAFRAVGGEPRFMRGGDGAYLTDQDGNRLLDYVSSWGPLILGHNRPEIRMAVQAAAKMGLSFGAPCEGEVLLAETVARIAPVEMVRLVNSGTEAVMSALRVARGWTGRDKVIKFAGCYHGHSDGMLVKAGSGALTIGVPDSAGVPRSMAEDTLTAVYNDLDSVDRLFSLNPGGIAAVIVEPVAANMGVVPPAEGFLRGLRDLCDRYGALLVFDEVITGFRLSLGGAQSYYGVEADLVAYGKIIGGGMPVGAYGGRRELMELAAPLGPVYQAGTLSGNPVAVAAGLAQLRVLEENPQLYAQLDEKCQILAVGLENLAAEREAPVQVNRVGSLCCMFFSYHPVKNYNDAMRADTGRYARFFHGMLEQGIYLAPSQFEAMFISAAHTGADIAQTLRAAKIALERLS